MERRTGYRPAAGSASASCNEAVLLGSHRLLSLSHSALQIIVCIYIYICIHIYIYI